MDIPFYIDYDTEEFFENNNNEEPLIFYIIKTNPMWPFTLSEALRKNIINNDNIDLIKNSNGDTLFKVICGTNKQYANKLLEKLKPELNIITPNNETCLMDAVIVPDKIKYEEDRKKIFPENKNETHHRKLTKEEIINKNKLIDNLLKKGADLLQTLNLLVNQNDKKKELFKKNFDIYKNSNQNTQTIYIKRKML